MQKIYRFFLHAYDLDNYPGVDVDYIPDDNERTVFYAWTPNKKIRKHFKSTRDMSKFYEDYVYVEDDELEKYESEFDNLLLEERPLTTKVVTNGVFESIVVLVLSTLSEVDHVILDYENILGSTIGLWADDLIPFNSECFNNPYSKALKTLQFNAAMRICVSPYEELPFTEIIFDHLAIYVHEFMNTYRKDVEMICEYMNTSRSQQMKKELY